MTFPKCTQAWKKVIKKKVNPIFDQFGIKRSGMNCQKITDIHLHSKDQDEAEEGGDILHIYIFSAVATCFMLIIACINI